MSVEMFVKDTMEVKEGGKVKRCPNPGRKEYLVGGSTVEQTWGRKATVSA